MSRAGRFAFAALIALLSPVLLLQGLANAQIPLGPARDWNGYWLALLSVAQLQVERNESNMGLGVSEQGAQLARRAFAKEPLAGDALFVLAVEQRQDGNIERMNAILEGAYSLDKRNRNIGALQLEQAALRGDLERTFGIVDRLATIYPSLTGNFVRPLVAALAEESAAPVLRDALEEEPVWAGAFWRAAPGEGELLTRFYALRQEVRAGATPESDARLLQRLVAAGRYGPAFEFWSQIAGEDAGEHGFVSGSDFPPLGWELTSMGERAMTARGDARFDVYVQNDTEGELARQIVQLDPGTYTLSADITPVSDAGRIEARLQCATSDEAVAIGQPLDSAATWTVSSECETYWLVLYGSGWNRREPLRVTISDIQFQAN